MRVDERGGYVKLYRKIRDNPVWPQKNEPYSRLEAWEDLIMDAEYRPRDRLIEGRLIHNERGQLTASIRFLAKRWHWGPGAVRGYLSKLQKAGQIKQNLTQGITQITICKYDHYNPPQHSNEQSPNTSLTHREHKPNKQTKKETNNKPSKAKIDERAVSELSREGQKILRQLQALPGWERNDKRDIALISAFMSLYPNINYIDEFVGLKIWLEQKGLQKATPMRVRNWLKKAAERGG